MFKKFSRPCYFIILLFIILLIYIFIYYYYYYYYFFFFFFFFFFLIQFCQQSIDGAHSMSLSRAKYENRHGDLDESL
jgi:hypothetical protein